MQATTQGVAMSALTDRPPRHRPRRGLWVILLTAAVAVVALVIAVAALTRAGPEDPGTVATADVAATRQIGQGCQQWLASDPAAARPDAQWCGALTDWMTDRMSSGHMMGPAMWRDADTMRDTCVRAMSGYPGTDDPAQWCRDMVAWMSAHMGGWTDEDGEWNGWHMGPR
jgi:hypothetical protein